MGALDDGPTCREYMEGAIDRDDINWELKSAIRFYLTEHDRMNKRTHELEDQKARLRMAFDQRKQIDAEEIKRLERARDHYRDIAEPYAKEIGKLLKWQHAVHDAMVINHSFPNDCKDDARKAVAHLIKTEVDMALDPRISEPAAKLLSTPPPVNEHLP